MMKLIYYLLRIIKDGLYARAIELWDVYYSKVDMPEESYGYATGKLACDLANLYKEIADTIPKEAK